MERKNRVNIYYTIIILLILFFLVFIMPITKNVYAESLINSVTNPSFELIGRDSGLSNLSVSSIIQDRYGFLWFGTQGGLNCYDGREIKVYRNNPFKNDGLVHNLIQTMYYDKENHELWIGTYQGVSRFFIDNKKFKNYTVKEDGLSNSVVIAITIDKINNVWIGTMNGLNKLNPQTGTIKHYQIPGNVVRSLKIDSQGSLLIGTYKGLFYYDKYSDSIKKIKLDLPSSYVMVIKEFKEGILTLGLWDGGIAKVDIKTGDIKIRSFEDNRVYSIIKTNDGTEWVGTWGGGLYAIKNDGKIYYFSANEKDNSLPHPIVYSMFQDYSDILWIGTNGGGLCKVNPRKKNFVKFLHDSIDSNSLSNGKVNSIYRDSKHNLWFAIYNSGLNCYVPSKDRIIKYKNIPDDPYSLPHNSIMDFLQINDKKLLLATGEGLAYYDLEQEKFFDLNILDDAPIVYCIAKAGDSELWIGTYTNGVYRYNMSNQKLRQYKYAKNSKYFLSDNLVYDLLFDHKERIWVATNNGLNVLKPGKEKFEIYHKVSGDYNQLASNIIRVLFEDSRGRIWIGMAGGGIAFYNERKDIFRSFTEEDGLSNNTVTGILEDNNGRIWASTHSGISIIDPENGKIHVLTPDDGIGGWEFNSGHYKDYDSTLLFGGIHGITAIPANYTNKDSDPPLVYITDIDLCQNSIDPNRSFFNDARLNFDYKDKFLGFKFVALDYDSPKKVVFSYKLDGFDKDWIYTGTRNYASYSNLPPGDYQLKVVAETIRGVRSDVASVYFTIDKPWFKTNIAYICYGIAFLLLILAMTKIREWYLLNQKNSELANINKKLNEANQQLERLSTKDHLTGLFNRRYFNTIIEELLNLARRSNAYLTLIMLDVDKFKLINDNFGHLVGDYYLSDISKAILRKLPRSTDFATRYGGDEFAIVLYDTDQRGALKVAKNIKKAIANVSIRSKNSSSEKIKITVSMGLVSVIPDKKTTIESIIHVADQALYRAKQEGRARICVGESEAN